MALSLTTNKPLLMAMKAQIYDELSRKMGEREEGERERKVASDYELNFRYFNADAFEVFVKMYKLAFGKQKDFYSYTEGPANAFVVVVEKTYPMIKKA
ncbi:uncharacterized protein LOC115950886 isoform X2 [Quercus lobata]|uniref:uncharacterized protein LOC115950886 isoform X2 n=1 Tax=Quercus lobata TaxID=97700 RepID=UPI0012440852|nr:uncharacterized protein LOC115950886 isoform X2 [Quercus lobata]